MDRLLNSRLRTSLVWGNDPLEGLLPESDPAPAPVTGPVPACWAALLDVRHINRYYARITSLVEDPVELETRGGSRRVAVLGQAVFEIDANGFVAAYLWDWVHGEPACLRAADDQISVGDTPYQWSWLDMFRRGFVVELLHRLGAKDELVPYSHWVFDRFRRKLVAECDLRAMRERVRAALALDPLAMQVARRIRLDCQRSRPATLREYNHAIAHLGAYRTLQKEAPNLVPLYAAHAAALTTQPPGEPAQRLKRYLAGAHGITDATWALAHRMRPRWLHLIRDFHEGDVADATADVLQVMQEVGCRQAPPRWYLWHLLQLFGNDARRHARYAEFHAPYVRATHRLTALIEAADHEQLRDIREHVYEVLAWIVDDDAQCLRGITRAGWPWFKRHAAEWRTHQEKAAAAEPGDWPVPFERFEAGDHAVVALRNHLELVHEARALKHCVDRFHARCASGMHLVLSVRQAGRERPLATAWLKHEGGRWWLAQLAGTANSIARPVARRLVTEALRGINAMRWRSPLSAKKSARRRCLPVVPAEEAANAHLSQLVRSASETTTNVQEQR
jgi:hypothetical protein